MDTQSAGTIEIPNFKLAKVGKDRERRRAGGGWLSGGRGAGSGFSGALGGSGAAGGGGGILALTGAMKSAILLLMAAGVSAGAWQYGKMRAAQYDASMKNGGGAKVFDTKGGAQKYDDLSGVVKADNAIPNSLGYISGSTDGLTPEERAKKAAEAEAARKADEEAKKKADEEANKQPAEPASTAPDPKAVAESAAPKKGLTAGKFGQLGSFGNSGGGLSGGAGLSGGINRNFGAASGVGGKAQNGAMASFRTPTKPGTASAPHAAMAKSNSKGFAKRQLDNAFGQSRQAMSAGKGETAASGAAAPFDNNPGVGNVIAGPGMTNGSKAGAGDGGGGLNPTNSGGPLDNSSGAACKSADYAPDQNGVCQKIKTNPPKNDAPYQWMIDLAKTLMILTSILGALALIYAAAALTWGIAEALKKIIMVLGVIEIGLGAAILAMTGDKMMGGIVMAVGALTVASAAIPADVASLDTNDMAIMAAGTLISNAVGALAGSAASKSQLQ